MKRYDKKASQYTILRNKNVIQCITLKKRKNEVDDELTQKQRSTFKIINSIPIGCRSHRRRDNLFQKLNKYYEAAEVTSS